MNTKERRKTNTVNSSAVNRDECDYYLTPYDLVDMLEMNISTVYSLCRSGVIPAKKFGRQWRISRQALENSMRGKNL